MSQERLRTSHWRCQEEYKYILLRPMDVAVRHNAIFDTWTILTMDYLVPCEPHGATRYRQRGTILCPQETFHSVCNWDDEYTISYLVKLFQRALLDTGGKSSICHCNFSHSNTFPLFFSYLNTFFSFVMGELKIAHVLLIFLSQNKNWFKLDN